VLTPGQQPGYLGRPRRRLCQRLADRPECFQSLAPMGARTTAREAALQMLYALDSTGVDVERIIADFWKEAR